METNPDNLRDFEQQLRALRPALPQLSPEQLLYRAGWDAALAHVASTAQSVATVTPVLTVAPAQAAVSQNRRRAAWYWPASTAALVLLSATLGWRVWEQRVSAPINSAPIASAPVVSAPPATASVVSTPSVSASQLSSVAPPRIESPSAYAVPYPATYTSRQETRDEIDYRALANYLELRDRISRGGLSMLPTPVYRGDEQPRVSRPTQRELLAELWREVL